MDNKLKELIRELYENNAKGDIEMYFHPILSKDSKTLRDCTLAFYIYGANPFTISDGKIHVSALDCKTHHKPNSKNIYKNTYKKHLTEDEYARLRSLYYGYNEEKPFDDEISALMDDETIELIKKGAYNWSNATYVNKNNTEKRYNHVIAHKYSMQNAIRRWQDWRTSDFSFTVNNARFCTGLTSNPGCDMVAINEKERKIAFIEYKTQYVKNRKRKDVLDGNNGLKKHCIDMLAYMDIPAVKEEALARYAALKEYRMNGDIEKAMDIYLRVDPNVTEEVKKSVGTANEYTSYCVFMISNFKDNHGRVVQAIEKELLENDSSFEIQKEIREEVEAAYKARHKVEAVPEAFEGNFDRVRIIYNDCYTDVDLGDQKTIEECLAYLEKA